MPDQHHLFTFASWEERFTLSFTRILDRPAYVERVSVFYSQELADQTLNNRQSAKMICRSRGIDMSEICLSLDKPAETWELLNLHITNLGIRSAAILDFSTMPRDILWIVLYLLNETGITVEYNYHRPSIYLGGNWISRDPGRPRLVYKLSGVSRFGMRTALVILTGFDVERTQMLVNRFEPSKIILGLQTGSQYKNQEMNVKRHRECFGKYDDVEMIDVDAYANDCGYSSLKSKLETMFDAYNIIASSLGPKPSAIALFRLRQSFPSLALAYTPSREYNMKYSSGIGELFCGNIPAKLRG